MRFFPALLKSIALLLCVLAAGSAAARTRVVMATDSWAHLMYLDRRQVPAGPIPDFLNRMNAVQDQFAFELVIYPRLRVDTAFSEKTADVYPLRTVAWTKPEFGLLPTRTILTTGDVYFARRNNRYGGHKVFAQLPKVRIAGVLGYHYGIFNNHAEEAYIRKHHRNVYLLSSNEAVIKLVMAGRADVGIVPEPIMATFLADARLRAQVIVAEQYDSRVELSNLVRADGPISVDQMNQIVDLMIKSGDVRMLKDKLSIRKPGALRK